MRDIAAKIVIAEKTKTELADTIANAKARLKIDTPSFDVTGEILSIELNHSWMDEIVAFLKSETIPKDKKEAHRIRSKAAYYWLSDSSQLYRKSFIRLYLSIIHPTEVPAILTKLHTGNCGCHSGGRSLCQRALIQGYFWKGMKKDCKEVVKKCQQCQLFSPIPKQPT